jgi:rare lipoprotein A
MRSAPLTLAVLCILALSATDASAAKHRPAALSCSPGAEQPAFSQNGLATWYGGRSVGRRTASGQRMALHALTAAHRTLPFGSVVRVTNLENCRAVKVTINDRGPRGRGNQRRILDLSRTAAMALGMTREGVATIRIEEYQSDQPAG